MTQGPCIELSTVEVAGARAAAEQAPKPYHKHNTLHAGPHRRWGLVTEA
jgi:hypothetical protein